MNKKKSKQMVEVREGDIYAVPLPDGGFGRVVIARKARKKIVFGYFFGPRYVDVAQLEEATKPEAKNALFCNIFIDIGIQEGSWARVGRLEPWNRAEWPLPPFGRIADEARRIAYIDTYVNDDLDTLPVQRRCTPEEARSYPAEGLAGDRAAASFLAKILRGEEVPW